MYKCLLTFSLLLCSLFALCQDTTLQRLLAAKESKDKIDQLHAYAQTLLDKDNDKARGIYKITTELSEQLKYDLGTATAFRKVGYINGQVGDYKASIDCFRTAILFYSKGGGHLKDLLVCYNNIGANFRQFGKVDSAMHYYMLAVKRVEAWPMEKEEPAVKKDMLATLSLVQENISTLYGNLYDVPNAIAYGNKAMSVARSINDTLRLVLATVSTSHAFYVNKDFSKALALSRQAAALADTFGAPVAIAKAYHLLSVNYTALGKPDSGIYAAKKALDFARETDRQLYIMALLDLSDAYHDKKEYSKEEALLQAALKEFNEVDNITFGRNVYEKLSQSKYALGKYKEAYDLNVISETYKDSMFSKQNREAVAALEVQYQTAEKEKELVSRQLQLTNKNLQLQKSNQYIMYSLGASLLTLLALVFIYLFYKNKRKLHQRQLIAIQQEKEIQLLQALMQGEEKERSRIAKDLHDGVAGMLAAVKMHFSSLSLQSPELLQANEYRQGVKLLDEASVEVRKTSHNLMPEVLLQHGLDKALQRYCSSISNAHSLRVQYDSWGEIGRFKDGFELSVYRIVQELLNNIIKHSKAKQAIVQVSQQNDILSITVEDNGVGFGDNNLHLDGMGLKSLKARAAAINGKLELETAPGSGVSAYMEFETIGLEKAELV
jgi:signal transduction histidine kinase